MNVPRIEELERKFERLLDELAATKARLQAVDDRVMQTAGALSPMFGSSGAITLGRAVGLITASDGTQYGAGVFHFAEAPGGVFAEGADPTTVCKSIVAFEIADNSWLIAVKTPEWWVVIAVHDPCNDLARPV